jgi:GntR family transcriptional regulator
MVSFSGELRRQGHQVLSRTLVIDEEAPPAEVAQYLSAGNLPVTHVRRLLIVDSVPLALFEHWLPPTLPFAVFEAAGDFQSLYDLLKDQGCEPWYGTEEVGAVAADAETAGLLACEVGAPLLLLRRASRDLERRPIEYTTYLVRADRYEYEVNLVRQRR